MRLVLHHNPVHVFGPEGVEAEDTEGLHGFARIQKVPRKYSLKTRLITNPEFPLCWFLEPSGK